MERSLQRIGRPSSGVVYKQQQLRRPDESDPKLTRVVVSTLSTLDGQYRDDKQTSQDGSTSVWYERIPSRRVPLVRDEKQLASSRISSGRDTVDKPSSERDHNLLSSRMSSERDHTISSRISSGRDTVDKPSSGRDTAPFGRDRPPSERDHPISSSRISSGRDHTILSSRISSGRETVVSGRDTAPFGRDRPSSERDHNLLSSRMSSERDHPILSSRISSGRDTVDKPSPGRDTAPFGRDRPPSERDHNLLSSRISSGRDTADKDKPLSGRDIMLSSGEVHLKRLDVPSSQVAVVVGADLSPERVRGKYNVNDARVNFACITTRAQQYRQNQSYDKAETLLKEHLQKSQLMLGASHHETVNLMSHLAKTYFKHGKFVEAGELYKECLQITKSSLGPQHPDTLMAKNSLLTVYNQLGKPLRPTSARKLGSREI